MAYLLSLIVNGVTRLQNDTHGTNIYADKHIKNNSNDNYILLGGGGHIDKGTFALANHGVHWEGFTKRATSSATWGTLISASGYTPLFWLDSTNGGGVAFSDKGGQTFMQIDGYFYQNEGTNRVTDVTETVTALSTSGNYLTWTKNGTTNNITVPYATNAGYASSAGNADTLDNIDSTGFLRQVVVPNNTENDFNTFSNMTLTGRVDPTTGASLKNAPWSGSGPAGGYGVLTYLFNGSGYGTQMAWGYNSNKIYIRNRYWGGSGIGSIWSATWDAIALTSEIPTVTNYYWADQLITSSAKSNATPTFGSITISGGVDSGIALKTSGDYNRIRFYNSAGSNNATIHYFTAAHGGYTFVTDSLNLGSSGLVTLGAWNNPTIVVSGNTTSSNSNGKVGIGTTSPAYKLDVNGDVYTSSAFMTDKGRLIANTASNNGFIVQNGAGVNIAEVAYYNDHAYYCNYYGSTENAGIEFYDNGNTTIFTKNAVRVFRVLNTGHALVGKGTTELSTAWKPGLIVGPDGTDKIVATYLASSTNGATVGAHNSALTAWAPLHLAGTKIHFRINEALKMELTTEGQLTILKAGSAAGSGLVVGGDSFKSNISTSVADQTSMIQIVAGAGGASNSTAIGFHNPGISSAVLEYKNASADLGYFNFRSDDATWNVGIGTTTPSYKLHVRNSSTNFSIPAALTENNATGTTWYAVHAFTNPNMSTGEYAAIQVGKVLNNKNCGHLSFYYAGNESNDNRFALGFYNVIDLIVAKASGNVGIGNSSPENKLDVNGIQQIYQRGNDNTTFKDLLLLKQQNSTESANQDWGESYPTFGIGFRRYWTSGSSPYGETTCAGIYATVSSSWRGGLVFRTKNNTTQGGTHDVTALRLRPDGIAMFMKELQTTNGVILQQVKNTWLDPARVQIGRVDASVYSDRSCIGTTDGNLHIDAYKNKDIYLNYYQSPGTTNGQESTAVVIKPSGNVGIGTASPSHKLHVKGTTWIDAGTYIANRATLILNSNNAPADIIFKSLSSANGNYGHWALSSRSGESSTRFSIFRGVENANVKSELELFTLRPNGDLDIKGTLNLWNSTCDSNHDEGIRLHPSKHGWNALVFCGTDNNEDIGTSAKTWGLYTYNGNLYINKNSADASAANSATLCNVSNNWGIGTVSPGYNLTVSGTTYADKSLIAISGTDANKYAGNANYYHLAIGSKATSTGASILLYRADTTTQHAIVWCTGSGDHAGISVDSGSNDLGIWNNKGVLRLKKQTIIDNVEHSLQIYRTYNYHPCLNDTAGRPGISISGNYPYLWLTGGGVANTSHGATITLAAPDTAGSTNGDIKTWTFGVPGQGATWMDLAYSVNTANPHNGIADWQDGAKAKHRIMRWSTSPQNQVLIYGTGYDSAASLVVNSSRTGTWIYGASIFAPSMGKGHNVWLNVGKANSTCNSFGISWHHAGGDGSTSNYGAIEIWGKGNVQRWYGDLHTQFLGRVDVANIGYSTYNYDTASMQIREYNYGGAQTDTWGYAPRLTWHWSGRVAAQIGLASNGYLYTAPLTGTTFYKLVYESGTWGINITGNAGYASSAGNADKVDGYHASSLWRSDGGVWNPTANITLGATANSQEWSFDITRNGYTGCYWHVWDSQLSTMLRVNADDGKVSAPYGFVGNLTGTASSVTVNNSDYNSTYRMVWHSGDNLYGTGGIYCNPSTDALYATRYYATGSAGPHFTGTSTAGNWAYLRLNNSSVLWDIATNSSSTSVGANALDFREKGADYAGIAIRYNTSSYGRLVVMNNTNTETSIGYLNTKFSSSVPIWTVGAGIGNSTSFGWWYYNVGCKMYLTTDGYVYAAAYYESSDQRLKNFHNSIDANLDKLKSIPKKYFSWKKDNENKLHIGTSAQAIRELYPELVSESEDGMLSVDYAKLSIVALKAIDVLHDEIKLLKSTNSRLEKRIQELEK